MAEVVTEPLTNQGILYTQKQLENMESPHSKLKPVKPGDACCSCRGDCDGEGFAIGEYRASRIHGHPFCARGACYIERIKEFIGKRTECTCGLKERRKRGEI